MAYATATDVTDRLGKSADDALTTLITTRLADVERMIKRRIPDLVAQLAATPPTIDVEDVKQVEADAVLRLARNPEGYFSETDGNYTYQFIQDLASGKLEILPDEWAILGILQYGMLSIAPKVCMPEVWREPWWWW